MASDEDYVTEPWVEPLVSYPSCPPGAHHTSDGICVGHSPVSVGLDYGFTMNSSQQTVPPDPSFVFPDGFFINRRARAKELGAMPIYRDGRFQWRALEPPKERAEDATYENESHLNPRPATLLAHGLVCVSCRYNGPFQVLSPAEHPFGRVVMCLLCRCLGREVAFK